MNLQPEEPIILAEHLEPSVQLSAAGTELLRCVVRALAIRHPDTAPWTKEQTTRSWAQWERDAHAAIATVEDDPNTERKTDDEAMMDLAISIEDFRRNIRPLREEADMGRLDYSAYDEQYNEWLETLHTDIEQHLEQTGRLQKQGHTL